MRSGLGNHTDVDVGRFAGGGWVGWRAWAGGVLTLQGDVTGNSPFPPRPCWPAAGWGVWVAFKARTHECASLTKWHRGELEFNLLWFLEVDGKTNRASGWGGGSDSLEAWCIIGLE